MMGDKDIETVLNALVPCASSFYFTRPDTERAADPRVFIDLTDGKFDGKRVIVGDVGDAVGMAVNDAGADDVICVTGSFYTVSEAMKAL
jgi:dihydrofolate synthase/folylpolyglutamate synthase